MNSVSEATSVGKPTSEAPRGGGKYGNLERR